MDHLSFTRHDSKSVTTPKKFFCRCEKQEFTDDFLFFLSFFGVGILAQDHKLFIYRNNLLKNFFYFKIVVHQTIFFLFKLPRHYFACITCHLFFYLRDTTAKIIIMRCDSRSKSHTIPATKLWDARQKTVKRDFMTQHFFFFFLLFFFFFFSNCTLIRDVNQSAHNDPERGKVHQNNSDPHLYSTDPNSQAVNSISKILILLLIYIKLKAKYQSRKSIYFRLVLLYIMHPKLLKDFGKTSHDCPGCVLIISS